MAFDHFFPTARKNGKLREVKFHGVWICFVQKGLIHSMTSTSPPCTTRKAERIAS
uniref:Uncharacterized protein n=1 Tax=Arundo donax TaxID=35708 RepID=A0A0A8ZWK0_ARUDO